MKKKIDLTEEQYALRDQAIDLLHSYAHLLSREEINRIKEVYIEFSLEDNGYSFDEFWNEYGKKIDRELCRRAFQKLTKGERSKIKAHLPDYILSTSGEKAKFRRNPINYLKNKTWQSEIVAVMSNFANVKEQEKSDLPLSVALGLLSTPEYVVYTNNGNFPERITSKYNIV